MPVSFEARPAPAKAMPVSIPHEHERAKAMAVSDKWAIWPTGPRCDTQGRRQGLAGQRVDAQSTHQRPSAAGVEGAGGTGGPGCGARGQQGLARQHTDTPTDWRPPRGLRGLAGLRADAPSEARGAGGERAGRSRGGRRSGGAAAAAGDLAGQRRWSQIWRGCGRPQIWRGCGRPQIWWGYGQHWKTKGKWGTDTKNRRPVGHRLSVRHGGLEPSTR